MPFKKGETPIGAKPFVKGQSGNPAGREKGAKTRATIARNWLEVAQTLKNPITNVTESMSQEDIMTLSLIKEAREGNVNAYKALMDSAYGAPKQDIDANVNQNIIKLLNVDPLSDASNDNRTSQDFGTQEAD